MTFREYLLQKKKPIQQTTTQFLSRWRKSTDSEIPALTDLTQILLETNQGGKNIRGALVCLGYDMQKVKKERAVYTVAAAYEILHTSLLVHDDIMDNSLIRRGMPTLFQKLGGNHYGISQAICLGDIGFFLATKMIHETTFASEIKSLAVLFFSQTVLNTINGQMLDIKHTNTSDAVTEEDVLTLAQLKTAQYTISGPLVLGAILAGADKKYTKRLALFGNALGIAFQIKDDMLGVFGDEVTIGKSNTSDITEGKQTLLIAHALANATKKQKDILKKHYGKGSITAREHALIKEIFYETGAVHYAEKIMKQYSAKAFSYVSQLTKDKAMQSLINDFIIYLIQREK